VGDGRAEIVAGPFTLARGEMTCWRWRGGDRSLPIAGAPEKPGARGTDVETQTRSAAILGDQRTLLDFALVLLFFSIMGNAISPRGVMPKKSRLQPVGGGAMPSSPITQRLKRFALLPSHSITGSGTLGTAFAPWLPRAALTGIIIAMLSGTALAYRPFDGTDAAVAKPGEMEVELAPADLLREHSQSTVISGFTILNFGVAPDWEAVFSGQGQIPQFASGDPLSIANVSAFLKAVVRPGYFRIRVVRA
jgi:hypothetical protein